MLAVVAVVLAMFGFDVDCGCYSEYLSGRDLEAFHPLFEAFLGKVQANIRYGTFNVLCERLLNKHGDVRTLVSTRVNGTGSQSAGKR